MQLSWSFPPGAGRAAAIHPLRKSTRLLNGDGFVYFLQKRAAKRTAPLTTLWLGVRLRFAHIGPLRRALERPAEQHLNRLLRVACRSNAAGERQFASEASSSHVNLSPSSSPSSEAVGGGTKGRQHSLWRRLINLVYPKRSAVVSIRKWIEEGNHVEKHQLIRLIRYLRRQNRHKHALEICEWIGCNFRLQAGDYAIHLDLVAKVRGLASAEKFFEDLPEPMKKQPTWTSLLHTYVQNNMVTKAEVVMKVMFERGFLNCSLAYNHMINLYISNNQTDKALKMIESLKRNTLPDIITYNLWLTLCAKENDVLGAEKVLIEMRGREIIADWVTYSILTKIYINQGLPGRSRKALKEMEKLISRESRSAYCSLLSLHASLSDNNDLNRIWMEMISLYRNLNDAEYLCMIACLVKVGDIERAENIYGEWETGSGSKDARVSNILLSAYTKKAMMDKAEKFIMKMEEKGPKPNYRTWEMMAWGYLDATKMAEVLCCLEKSFAATKKWQPDDRIVNAVFEKFRLLSDVEGAERFLLILRNAGHVTTEVYNLLLQTYASAGKMPLIVAERMKRDNVQPDEETRRLVEVTRNFSASRVTSLIS